MKIIEPNYSPEQRIKIAQQLQNEALKVANLGKKECAKHIFKMVDNLLTF